MNKMFTAYACTLLTHYITPLYTQACSTQPPMFLVYFGLELSIALPKGQ